jgi:hypothetical protein
MRVSASLIGSGRRGAYGVGRGRAVRGVVAAVATGPGAQFGHGPPVPSVIGSRLKLVPYQVTFALSTTLSRGALRCSALPQLTKPCTYLLVVVQVAAPDTSRKINSVEEVQRPPRQLVPDRPVLDHPPRGPAVGLVPGQPPLDKGSETIFDLIKGRLATDIHAPNLQAGQTLPDAAH